MKRRDLLRHLLDHGCRFVREGGRHSWWENPAANKRSSIPRHTEVNDYLAKKKAAFQERDERVRQIRQSLEPQVAGAKTRLTAVSPHFTVGSPMHFRLELVNSGPTALHYTDLGVRYKSLTVRHESREAVEFKPQPLQIMVQRATLAAGATVVLAEQIDINRGHEIVRPGKYTVQFDSRDLQIGQPIPLQEFGRFGENIPLAMGSLLAATNVFPSNVIEIEVHPSR